MKIISNLTCLVFVYIIASIGYAANRPYLPVTGVDWPNNFVSLQRAVNNLQKHVEPNNVIWVGPSSAYYSKPKAGTGHTASYGNHISKLVRPMFALHQIDNQFPLNSSLFFPTPSATQETIAQHNVIPTKIAPDDHISSAQFDIEKNLPAQQLIAHLAQAVWLNLDDPDCLNN